ncbi:threonine synthase [Segnochrobactrum spirostomi]|uniref:Threonine synthase n=1 Tax=Segnochrobactrum spirostomi TaxID=2608987 RepID=A0A6A7Y454_9HYPH|nr:threonine synthase [Segnochrobactrum spirostomi]MQT13910.1 threonine synthase [Segnochrobactrum spirostomi]
MRYVSTRGQAPALGFLDVLVAGLARDGGLYVPETWPTLADVEIADFAGRPYAEVAHAVIRRFVDGEIEDAALYEMIEAAYAGFGHRAVAPLVQIGPGHFLLELFHGPTLAFKDVAMQLLARLMEHALARTGAAATIIGATSGDTGASAIEAFRGRAGVDVVILFPEGRVSPVQQRQMTTVADANVHALALAGTFDDAQAIVKGLFNDHAFRDRTALAGVNSINWARIVAQVVYYFTAAVALGAPHRPVSFTVPTGNFGDIFAGYVAKRMGLPIAALNVATNVNDILARTLETGRYEVRGVTPSTSPSMDIQVSSNFERLLFEALGRDGAAVRGLMGSLSQSGAFTVPPAAFADIRAAFGAGRCDIEGTRDTIARVLAETGTLIDPHTAVGVAVAERLIDRSVPMVTLATAHPAKFPDAVFEATGVRPALPPRLADLMERPERVTRLPAEQAAVARFIEAQSRAVRAEA